jgi:predicted DNA-binding antitoxin AbrB/MazE fold protein
MTFHADAIYEGGVLRPLVPLDLKEHDLVSLSISPYPDPDSVEAKVAQHRTVVKAYVTKVESRPDEVSPDGLTNRDHDRLIYGS